MLSEDMSQSSTIRLRMVLLFIVFVFMLNHPAEIFAAGQKVTIMDRGLNMPMSIQTIPKGWKLVQDIATNPRTGRYSRYKLDTYGPQGQVTRSLAPLDYGPLTGVSIQQAWRQSARKALRGILQNVRLGQPQRQGPLLKKMLASQVIRRKMEKTGVSSLFEVDISGKRNARSYEGKIFIAVLSTGPQSGVLSMGILLSPRGLLMKTIDANIRVAESKQPNPRHAQAIKQISQRVMQNMRAGHKKRMRDNRASFNAHQRKMKGIYERNDRKNKKWMNDFRNDGYRNPANNGYSKHDAYIDSIHERNTFKDPSSGNNVSRDGQYKYNYSNGLGNYYGTDDPGFNPRSLTGNWQIVEPLK